MKKEKVYLLMYNPCIHESAFGVLSVHETKRGAEIAMEYSKKEAISDDLHLGEIQDWEVWRVEKFNIEK